MHSRRSAPKNSLIENVSSKSSKPAHPAPPSAMPPPACARAALAPPSSPPNPPMGTALALALALGPGDQTTRRTYHPCHGDDNQAYLRRRRARFYRSTRWRVRNCHRLPLRQLVGRHYPAEMCMPLACPLTAMAFPLSPAPDRYPLRRTHIAGRPPRQSPL